MQNFVNKIMGGVLKILAFIANKEPAEWLADSAGEEVDQEELNRLITKLT